MHEIVVEVAEVSGEVALQSLETECHFVYIYGPYKLYYNTAFLYQNDSGR